MDTNIEMYNINSFQTFSEYKTLFLVDHDITVFIMNYVLSCIVVYLPTGQYKTKRKQKPHTLIHCKSFTNRFITSRTTTYQMNSKLKTVKQLLTRFFYPNAVFLFISICILIAMI